MPRPALDKPEPKLVRIKGRNNWYIRWTPPGTGRSKVISTGCSLKGPKDDADRALDRFIEALETPDVLTISAMLDARFADLENRGKSTRNATIQHKPLKENMGHLQCDDLTDARIGRYVRSRNHPTAARRELEELRTALLFAERRGWILKAPVIQMPGRRPPRDTFLSKSEALQLIGACQSEHVKIFMLIGFSTGARRNAILGLTWDRVDLERGYIDFNDPTREITKKRRASVKIDPRLIAVLREAKKDAATDHVIEYHGKPLSKINRGFELASKRAGVKASPHLMKHTAISWLSEDGYTVDQISDMTATDPATVRRIYRKFNPDYLAELSTSLADKLFAPRVALPSETSQSMKR